MIFSSALILFLCCSLGPCVAAHGSPGLLDQNFLRALKFLDRHLRIAKMGDRCPFPAGADGRIPEVCFYSLNEDGDCQSGDMIYLKDTCIEEKGQEFYDKLKQMEEYEKRRAQEKKSRRSHNQG